MVVQCDTYTSEPIRVACDLRFADGYRLVRTLTLVVCNYCTSVERELRPSSPVFYMGITRPRVYVSDNGRISSNFIEGSYI